jgi:hypothetical protein
MDRDAIPPYEQVDSILHKALPQVSQDSRGACTAELVREYEKLLPERDRYVNKSLNERDTYYAIHNDDLKLIDESAAIAAGLWALMSNPIAVIGKLLVLLYRYRRKRAKLTGEQALVLLSLKNAPAMGWTTYDLQQDLRSQRDLPLDKVWAILQSLKNVPLDNGQLSDFVAEHQNRWRVIDV